MEIILLIAALICAAASVTAAFSLARCLRALEEAAPSGLASPKDSELDELRERAMREQRRFEEALAGILSYGQADMRRRPGEEV